MDIRKYIIPGVIGIYLVVSTFVWGWLLLDIVLGNFNVFQYLGLQMPIDPNKLNLLRIAFYAMIGGAFGGISFGMMNLQRHTTGEAFKSYSSATIYSGHLEQHFLLL